jgi:hypothetical protein
LEYEKLAAGNTNKTSTGWTSNLQLSISMGGRVKKHFVLKATVAIFALFLNFSGYTAIASIPHLINYQGMLTDNSGTPLSGSYNLTFKIWTDTTAGSSLWTETQNGTPVTNGLFNVLFGKQTALNLAFDQQYWLEVGVGAETMPRIRFTSVGYAYRAEKSDTASYALTGPWGSNNIWTFLISDGADTTIRTGGRWGIARYGNGLYGTADSTHVSLGVACSTGASGQNRKYCTVSGGFRNIARDNWTTLGGGYVNLAAGSYATVSGGGLNQTYGDGAAIGGGWLNSVNGLYGTIGGGELNSAYGNNSTVGGGEEDTAYSTFSGVSSGFFNIAGHVSADTAAYVGGGIYNCATAKYATIGGGQQNSAGGSGATIAGGIDNSATVAGSTIGGGSLNVASATYATVGGGYNNWANGDYSAILGGYGDTISSTGDYSYLFGIKSKLTQDSTFMVDMPHIRFGKESGGYEFPTSDGASGQVMQTNGSGQLSWVNASGGGWTDGGTRVYLAGSSDSVGIGTSSPTQKLQVEGSVKLNKNDGYLVLSTSSHNNPDRFKIKFDNNGVAPFVGDDTEDQYFDFYSSWSATRTYDTHLKVHGSSYSGSWGKYIELTHNGMDGTISTDTGDIILQPAFNVGVGTSDPKSKLDVNGTHGYDQIRMRTSYTPTGTVDTNGNTGDIAWDNSYFYVKTSSGWKRAALSTF